MEANLHPGNRLPIFINNLASQVGRNALSLSNCAKRGQKRDRQECANPGYPKILAQIHFASHGYGQISILSWMRGRNHAFPKIEDLGL